MNKTVTEGLYSGQETLSRVVAYAVEEQNKTRKACREEMLKMVDEWAPEWDKDSKSLAIKIVCSDVSEEDYIKALEENLKLNLTTDK